MSIKEKLWQQHRIGETWGRFALAGSQITVFVSMWTMLAVTIDVYTPIKSWVSGYGINLPLWGFMAVIIVPIIIAYLFAWKFLVASYYRTSVEQFWKQGSEWTAKLDKIDALESQLKDLNRKLDEVLKK